MDQCYVCLNSDDRKGALRASCTQCSAKVHAGCWRRLALWARSTQFDVWMGRRRPSCSMLHMNKCPICRVGSNQYCGTAVVPPIHPDGLQELLRLSRLKHAQEFLTSRVQNDLSFITVVCGCLGTTIDVLWYAFNPDTHWTLVVIPTLAMAYVIIIAYLVSSVLVQRRSWTQQLPPLSNPPVNHDFIYF